MAYQSMYGSGTAAPAKGSGYQSMYGFDVPKAPSSQQLAQLRQQQAAQAMQQQVQQKAAPQHQTLLNRVQGVATALGHAGRAVARPVTDVIGGTASAVNNEIHNKPVTTAALGKAVHDTAQLSSDTTGGLLNQFTKGVAQAPGAVAGEIASQSKNPYVRVQGVKAVQGAQKKAFGTNDSGTIAKKIIASTVGTGTLFAGGGELAGAKTLLKAGAKVATKQVAKDAAIGATGNASATVTQNPNASAKDISKSAAVGGLLGAVAPHAIKGAGDVGRNIATKVDNSEGKFLQPVKDVANTVTGNVQQGQNDLLQAKQNALLSKASSLETPQTSATHVPVTPHVSYEPTNPRVKTLIDSAQKRDQATQAPMKAAQAQQDKAAAQAEKAQADSQKVDRQIELLQAKGKDSETGLSNVDKTKLSHLQEDKAQVAQSGIVQEPHSIKVFGKTIPMTEDNGFKATPTKDGNVVYQKTAMRGNNAKGDRQAITHYYTSDGKNITQAQHDSMIKDSSTAPVEPVAKPVNESPNTAAPAKAETAQPTVAKESSTTSVAPETKPSTQAATVHQESITSRPESKVSGSALKSEQKAVESGLVKSLGDKAQYDTGSYKVEAANAVKLAHDNPEEAKAIAMGQKPGNNTIHEVAVRHAVEQQAIKEKDIQTLLDLSKSTQHTATSEAAQRLGTEGYHADHNSPVANIRAISKARQDAYKAKTGKSADAVAQSEIKQIRAATPKTTVTKETWGSFIDSLKC